MKRILSRVILMLSVLSVLVSGLVSCTKKGTEAAMEYTDPNGNVTASVDVNFVSLFLAISNYQNGVDGVSYWDDKIQSGNDATYRDLYVAGVKENIKRYLSAEYLNDYVYGIGFDEKQQDSVERSIDSMIAAKGSEKALESYLSTYGTNIDSLRRFMTLWSKYNTLSLNLYAKGGPCEITDAKVKNYFAENYSIADHVCISLTGGIKTDGTVIPLSEEEKAQKKALSQTVLNEINSGVVDFDTAVQKYNEDGYKTAYPEGYFIPDSGSAGLAAEVENAIRAMSDGEIRTVETSSAIYIIKKKPMNAELYKTKEGFGDNLRQLLEGEDFEKQLETADGVKVYDDVISVLDPAVIPSLNIDTLLQ